MRSFPYALFAFVVMSSPARSQELKVAATQESTPTEESTPRILGNIPDGTPPPPEAPKPEYIIKPTDVLETTTVEQGGRTITLREIKPIDLPLPPLEPAPSAPDPAFQTSLAAYQATHPKSAPLFLGATVYRSESSPPRTLVKWSPQSGGESINFWTSADFALIAGGINTFTDSAGDTHFMFISWGIADLDRIPKPPAANSSPSAAPTIPNFPAGKATFAFIGKAPADEDLLVIQSLHDLYNTNHDQLLTAYQGREQARLAQEAELKAHPPQPQDITLNYWRIGGGTPVKGSAQ